MVTSGGAEAVAVTQTHSSGATYAVVVEALCSRSDQSWTGHFESQTGALIRKTTTPSVAAHSAARRPDCVWGGGGARATQIV